MYKLRTDIHVLSIPAVDISSCRPKFTAQILVPRKTMMTLSARRCDPCHADSLSFVFPIFNYSNYLMSQYHWQMGRGSPTFDLIQLRVADSAARDSQQDFAFVEFRFVHLLKRKRNWIIFERRDLPQEHGFHGSKHFRDEHLCMLHVFLIFIPKESDTFRFVRFGGGK